MRRATNNKHAEHGDLLFGFTLHLHIESGQILWVHNEHHNNTFYSYHNERIYYYWLKLKTNSTALINLKQQNCADLNTLLPMQCKLKESRTFVLNTEIIYFWWKFLETKKELFAVCNERHSEACVVSSNK